MNKSIRWSRMLAMLLCVAIILTGAPVYVLDESAGCTHICSDGSSAYTKGVDCGHGHDESCGYQAEAPCGHVCGEDCAETCIHPEHDGYCGYAPTLPCEHRHDDECGYAAEIPCNHECREVCGAAELEPEPDPEQPQQPAGPTGTAASTAFGVLAADVVFDWANVTFSNQNVGYKTAPTSIIALRNNGAEAVSLTASLTGSEAGVFSITNGETFTVNAGFIHWIDFSAHTGLGAGAYTATLTVTGGGVSLSAPGCLTVVLPGTQPDAPQNFTATAGDGQVVLSWGTPASDGGQAITGYQVSKDNSNTWEIASSTTGHTFTGLSNGTTYVIQVSAVNAHGRGYLAYASATPYLPYGIHVCIAGAALSDGVYYSEPVEANYAPESIAVILVNSGAQPTGDVTLTLTGTDKASFSLSTLFFKQHQFNVRREHDACGRPCSGELYCYG